MSDVYWVVVAGSRNFTDYDLAESVIDQFVQGFDCRVGIVSGAARGADAVGERYAKQRRLVLSRHPADWDTFGKSAGFRRNVDMAQFGDALLSFWDGKSPGSGHMIATTRALDKPVQVVIPGIWREDTPVDEFQGRYRWLSNFWPAEVLTSRWSFPSVEHGYQALKFPQGSPEFYAVGSEDSPQGAKRAARKLKAYQLPYFAEIRETVMLELLRSKFSKEPLRSMLTSTRSRMLVEGNQWGDTFWGVCGGRGRNMLGKLIMRVRRELEDEDLLGAPPLLENQPAVRVSPSD